MSKKSYKKLQNRLYREIKGRILAEQLLRSKLEGRMLSLQSRNKKIETIKIDMIISDYFAGHEEFVKADMARKIASKLVADGYIRLYSTTTDFGGAMPIEVTKIEARLDVVRPEEGESQ